jgi:hypothetical protein
MRIVTLVRCSQINAHSHLHIHTTTLLPNSSFSLLERASWSILRPTISITACRCATYRVCGNITQERNETDFLTNHVTTRYRVLVLVLDVAWIGVSYLVQWYCTSRDDATCTRYMYLVLLFNDHGTRRWMWFKHYRWARFRFEVLTFLVSHLVQSARGFEAASPRRPLSCIFDGLLPLSPILIGWLGFGGVTSTVIWGV